MLLGQELKFKNKLCNLKLGTFFSALPGLGASTLSGRVASGASALSGRVGQNLRKFCRLFKNLINRFSFAVWLRQPTVLPIASPLF